MIDFWLLIWRLFLAAGVAGVVTYLFWLLSDLVFDEEEVSVKEDREWFE